MAEMYGMLGSPNGMSGYATDPVNPNYSSGMTEEERAQLNKNTNDISELFEEIVNLRTEIGNVSSGGLSTEFKEALHNICADWAYTHDNAMPLLVALDLAMNYVNDTPINPPSEDTPKILRALKDNKVYAQARVDYVTSIWEQDLEGCAISEFYEVKHENITSGTPLITFIADSTGLLQGSGKLLKFISVADKDNFELLDVYNRVEGQNYGSYSYNESKGGYYMANGLPTTGNKYVSFTFPNNETDIANSYCYYSDTGEVVFAGANTPYYGKSNIND